MVYNEKLRDIKIGITTTVAGKWHITRKIGEGAFGMVFECMDPYRPSERRALKAEITGADRNESLKMEIYVMKKMMAANAFHSAELFQYGSEKNYSFVVMTLLGMSLSDIRKRLPDEMFTIDSLIIIGIQSIDALKELHSVGFVHRDIKPSNFAIGKTSPDWIYLIDFGICREIMYTEDLQTKLKTPRRCCQFRGTTRYCSLNAHKRKELGRHDDLISVMYMLIEGLNGSLPWKHKDRVKTEKMKAENESEMLATVPKQFVRIFEYLRDLTYFQTPDYRKIRRELMDMAKEKKISHPYKLDWDEYVILPFEKVNKSVAASVGSKRRELLNEKSFNFPSDITTQLEVPDEFPNEPSCSDSDRTITSNQEKSKNEKVGSKKENKSKKEAKEKSKKDLKEKSKKEVKEKTKKSEKSKISKREAKQKSKKEINEKSKKEEKIKCATGSTVQRKNEGKKDKNESKVKKESSKGGGSSKSPMKVAQTQVDEEKKK